MMTFTYDSIESVLPWRVYVCVCVWGRAVLINGLSEAVSFRWDVFPKQGPSIYHERPQIQMAGLRDGCADRRPDAWLDGRMDGLAVSWLQIRLPHSVSCFICFLIFSWGTDYDNVQIWFMYIYLKAMHFSLLKQLTQLLMQYLKNVLLLEILCHIL